MRVKIRKCPDLPFHPQVYDCFLTSVNLIAYLPVQVFIVIILQHIIDITFHLLNGIQQ